MTTHVVLGGNGVVGRETIAALLARGHTVSSVSRSASASSAGVTSIIADLLDAASVIDAVQGAEVAYLTVGVPYSTKAWRRDWPTIMQNMIDACLAHGTRLVYFDNVYAYGRTDAPMTESTPIRPSSKKGALRASLLATLDTAARERGLDYTIGRSADFYGPGAATSVFNTFVLDNVAKGKAPVWLYDSSQPHSMTYTPDIGEALAVIGTDERARGQAWHVPTAPALTGAEYLELATGDKLAHKTMSTAAIRLGALFVAAARESLEMSYQNTAPYVFDSSAFESTFGITPTPYRDGIAAAQDRAAVLAR
ncbi:NAD-dependent epimerase/dehydratase family protein [Agromyces sp. ISL-38]|uniref:NAD-dependent epimerase/dehydratase family protein n=1 Tax=Agromyces sp. ISL-38 TaxID=2819107 RepID=UPI001BEC5186|nr:NAD-dependent epimerase/dehydratase family protein [Agromyces sp. ISL-38]MBT2498370.1 NAD-dependent epimerase/dehydratase family protein [Agromyces sp. ISL-38]